MKQRRRSSTSSTSYKRHTSCKKSNNLKALQTLNSLSWNITDRPDEAGFDVQLLDTPWCSGHVKLMLPIVKNASINDTSMNDNPINVYYQEDIKRANITFGHILEKIYNFYNFDKVIEADVTSVSGISSMKEFAAMVLRNYFLDNSTIKHLRFKHFLQGQTQFSGLKHQHHNIYTLNLV